MTTNSGYTFFSYGSERKLPFASIASADNEHDRVSKLDRPGIFRLKIGVGKPTFESLFGQGQRGKNPGPRAYDLARSRAGLPNSTG